MYITDAVNAMIAEGKRFQIVPPGAGPSKAHYMVADNKLIYVADPTGVRPNTNPPQEAEISLAMILSGDWTEITPEVMSYFGIEDAEPPPAPPAEPPATP